MMKQPWCRHCGARVTPAADGACPRCRRPLDPEDAPNDVSDQTLQHIVAPPGGSSDPPGGANPYQAPSQPDEPDSESSESRSPPFLKAAKFSVYAPVTLLCVNCCLQGQVDALDPGPAKLLGILLGGGGLLLIVAGTIAGFVGLGGGLRHGATGAVLLSLVGMAINLGFLVMLSMILFGTRLAP